MAQPGFFLVHSKNKCFPLVFDHVDSVKLLVKGKVIALEKNSTGGGYGFIFLTVLSGQLRRFKHHEEKVIFHRARRWKVPVSGAERES